jgi:ADP-heptose:LPS heptosyltransferase
MTRSPADTPPPPVRTGRYRYSKLRWRLSVGALDLIGTVVMALWRLVRPTPSVATPRRVLLVQLDHLGDAVLTSPLIERLRSAYPHASIDVLASASNHELFAADPNVSRVRLAERSWFERRRGRWAMLSAVWMLGRSLRGSGYDLGIDVRGDILTVFVLTLAGIPRRVGWTMGGGGFLLTDTATWVPGRHEVESRLALLDALGVPFDRPARVVVHVRDADRVEVAARLRDAWCEQESTSVKVKIHARGRASHRRYAHSGREPIWDEPDALHAGRFGAPPLLAVHLGAGTAAKRWPPARWRVLIAKFLADGWRVVVVGGPDDVEASIALKPHENLRDWTGMLTVTQTAALLERAELFIGADSGPSHLAAASGTPSVILFSGTNRVVQWRPWSRRSLVLRRRVSCGPCHCKVCPLANHPCMTDLHPDRVHRAAARWWARLHPRESPYVPL